MAFVIDQISYRSRRILRLQIYSFGPKKESEEGKTGKDGKIAYNNHGSTSWASLTQTKTKTMSKSTAKTNTPRARFTEMKPVSFIFGEGPMKSVR